MENIYRRVSLRDETARRQWVVTVGRVAEDQLRRRYGLEPSQRLIEDYIARIRNAHKPERYRFFDEAAIRVARELDEELTISAGEGGTTSHVRARAIETLRKRYHEIEEDPQRNYSFLDKLLITD